MNITYYTQSFIQSTITYVPVQQQQIHIHHHYNAVQPTFVVPLSAPVKVIQQEKKIKDQPTKIQKYEVLSSQIDKLFMKLNQIDQNINLISTSNQSSPQKEPDYEKEVKKKNRILIIRIIMNPQNIIVEIFNHLQLPQGKMKSLRNQQLSNNKFSRTKEQISRIELMKGIQFGEFIYFGDLNTFHLRHGYGTLYDLKGRIIYTGQWYQDQFHDRGKLFFYDLSKSSIKLESFENQQLVCNNRVSYTGQFENGQMKGLGQMLFIPKNQKEKFIFYGRFENGQFNGRGTVMHYFDSIDSVDSQKIVGSWRHGNKI